MPDKKAEAEQHIRWATQGSSGELRAANASIATAINLGRIADAMERIIAEEFDEPDRSSFNPDDFDYPETGDGS